MVDPMKENKCLFSLNYGDDQVIIAQDADDLEFILKSLHRSCGEEGETLRLTKQNL